MELDTKLRIMSTLDFLVPKFTSRWYIATPKMSSTTGWDYAPEAPIAYEEKPNRHVVKVRMFAWMWFAWVMEPKGYEGSVYRWSEFCSMFPDEVPEHLKKYKDW